MTFGGDSAARLAKRAVNGFESRRSVLNLRSYQSEAEQSILEQFRVVRSTLVEQATGTGKTVLFGHVAKRFLALNKRVLIIAHREELIWQAADAIRNICHEEPAIEMADHRVSMRNNMFAPKVVIATVQTMSRRLKKFGRREFGLIVFDECHHSVATSYRKIEKHFEEAKVLGVTATADRTDKKAMGRVFESVAFQYGIVDGIKDGWLVPIRQRTVQVKDLDFSQVRSTAGDLNMGDLGAVMEYERNLHEIASPLFEIAGQRKTLVFAVTVNHAERLCEILNRHEDGCAEFVCGVTPKARRSETLARYKNRSFRFLVNVGVFTEGFDDPGVEVVAIARPTKSRALYAQMVGRGTRPLPGLVDGDLDAAGRREAITSSGKPFVEVLDFEGNAGRHKLVNVYDVLGGKFEDSQVRKLKHKASDTEACFDVLSALEDEDEKEKERERKRKEKAAKRLGLVGKARYKTRHVDPFDIMDVQPDPERSWRTKEPATVKQVAVLEKMGIPEPFLLSKQEASRILDSAKQRRINGYCTFKQSAVLKKFGVNTDRMSMGRAGELIGLLKSNKTKFYQEIKKEQVAA